MSDLVSSGLGRATDSHRFSTTLAQPLFDPLAVALEKTSNIGTYECERFRKKVFQAYPLIAIPLASNYHQIANDFDHVRANQNLYNLDKRMHILDFNISWPLDKLQKFAGDKASLCRRYSEAQGKTETQIIKKCTSLAKSYGFSLKPETKDFYQLGVIKRFCCEKWWRRNLIKIQKRQLETIARDIGCVHRHSSAYASAYAIQSRSVQKAKTLEYLSGTMLSNDEGESFSLKDLYDRSVSNPKNRRAELMTRINGFELVAESYGDIGDFYTITAPSRMHARLSRNGMANPKYDGSNPADVNDYLQNTWQKIRAKFCREGLNPYGFRVAEPNHDGTPHWHLLLFMRPSEKKAIRRIFKHYIFEHDGNEKGARKHRFKAVAIDKDKGSAAGYIAKYIAKNIDGAHIESDNYGNDAKSSAIAIDAWASTWGIRQFQQIGGPSVTAWRELRRLSQIDYESDSTLLNEAVSCATAADWAAYCILMGGPRKPRSQQPIQPLYEFAEFVNYETGELLEDGLTEYGDPSNAKIKGLIVNGEPVITRLKTWVILKATVH